MAPLPLRFDLDGDDLAALAGEAHGLAEEECPRLFVPTASPYSSPTKAV